MINKHYQDLSDDNLVKIHNQLFPERTTNHKNNIKAKNDDLLRTLLQPFKKVLLSVSY